MKECLCIRITNITLEDIKNFINMRDIELDDHSIRQINEENYSVRAFITLDRMVELKKTGYSIKIEGEMTGMTADPRPLISQSNRFQKELKKLRNQKRGKDHGLS